MYWARSKHGYIPMLALETYAENSKGAAVEDAREVGKSYFLKYRSRNRGVWFQLAGLDGGDSVPVE
jgi:hypothetical protein